MLKKTKILDLLKDERYARFETGKFVAALESHPCEFSKEILEDAKILGVVSAEGVGALNGMDPLIQKADDDEHVNVMHPDAPDEEIHHNVDAADESFINIGVSDIDA